MTEALNPFTDYEKALIADCLAIDMPAASIYKLMPHRLPLHISHYIKPKTQDNVIQFRKGMFENPLGELIACPVCREQKILKLPKGADDLAAVVENANRCECGHVGMVRL